MKTKYHLLSLLLLATLLLTSCATRARVGELRTEAKSVTVGDAEKAQVKIDFGAGDLKVAGGSSELLEADFTYNVARLKPVVNYREGTLIIQQPGIKGLLALSGITEFRNEWDLRLNDGVPMDLRIEVGGGTGDLQLAELLLTGLDVSIGAGTYTIDLSGSWARDLNVTIDTGAADLTLLLPGEIGARVEVSSGPHTVDAPGLAKIGNAYINDAYGETEVELKVVLDSGIGFINLEVEEAVASLD